MKRYFFRFLLFAIILFSLSVHDLVYANENLIESNSYEDEHIPYSTIKVGLNYGESTVSEVRLKNIIDLGFQIGYFDAERNFIEVARISETDITLIPDWNWTTADGHSIGCYHYLLHQSFNNFNEALETAHNYDGFVAYYSGNYFVNIGHYTSPDEGDSANASISVDGSSVSQSNRCIVITESESNRIIFEFDCGSDKNLAVRPISDNENAVTEYNGVRYYGDFQFARLSGDQFMTAVNYVDIEDYTKCVIPYEMYASWPKEALKAQAMCARNFVATSFNRYRAHGFDVTADVYSQVYNGIDATTAETNAAAEATAGKYIRYEGEICQTFFFSSDGGATESVENVWGTHVPYLIGVLDPYEADVKTYSENWRYVCKPEELQTMVNVREHTDLDIIVDIECVYSDVGNIISIIFTDINGKTHTVNGNRCNAVMGAKSQRFTIIKDDEGNFVVDGNGWGHNCGMSQYGAYSMAKNHDMLAEDIIKFYYTGVYIR